MENDAKDIKKIITALFYEGWNRQIFSSFSEFVADGVAFNFRGERQITNIEELKGLVAYWRAAFPDLTFELLDIVVEKNLAAANLVYSGTHLGPWQGVSATGRKIWVEEMMFFRFDNGKIVEMWEVFDEAMMIKQIKGN